MVCTPAFSLMVHTAYLRTDSDLLIIRAGLYAMLDGFPTRAATALCTFAYSPGPSKEDPTKAPEVLLFEGRTEGTIVKSRGPAYFGWNPIFEVNGTNQTSVKYFISLIRP